MNTELKVVCQALAADLAIIYLDLRFAHLATVDLFRKVSGKGKMTVTGNHEHILLVGDELS